MTEDTVKSIDCIRCHTRMEVGFVPDLGEGTRQQRWMPGIPEVSFWTGLKTKVKKAEILPVLTYRCPNCGYLESYAAAKSSKKELR